MCCTDTGMGSARLQAEQRWDKRWAAGAGFGLCFAFHSFRLQWKPLTWGTRTRVNTPLMLLLGWRALQGLLLGGEWSCMTFG